MVILLKHNIKKKKQNEIIKELNKENNLEDIVFM